METLSSLKKQLASAPSFELLTELKSDSRVGVQKLLHSYYVKQQKAAVSEEKFRQRFILEQQYWQEFPYIAGIDEVGRGPLAGPVVSAAVILPKDFRILEVNDSKQLTDAKRQELFLQIVEGALAIGVGVQSEQVIDEINIYEATRLAMAEAVGNLDIQPNFLFVDAMQVPVDVPQLKLIKGDAKSNSIACASIVAKVLRDRLMNSVAQAYPGYDFANNDGYGTKKHLEGLEKLGVTPIHRQTFEPIKSMVENTLV